MSTPTLELIVPDSYGNQYLVTNINTKTGLGTVRRHGERVVSKKKFMKINNISKGQFKQARFNTQPKKG